MKQIVGLFRHVFQVFIAVVERISVIVMADFAKRGPGNEAVHRDVDLLTVFDDGGLGIPASFVLYGSP